MIHYPTFHIPRDSSINSFANEAEEYSRAFVRKFGLVVTHGEKRHFDGSLLGRLVSRTCPRADKATLELLSGWMSCNLVLDDLFDETSLGRDPERLEAFCDKVLTWLPADGVTDQRDDSPFARAYSDLWTRTCAAMSPRWRRRFRDHLSSFFELCVWEAENRKNGRVPAFDEYVAKRGCAFMPYIDLLEMLLDRDIPEEVYEARIVKELNQALSESVLWMNDLFSCEKEYRLGDVHNLVVIVHRANKCALQEAVNTVGALIQTRIDQFEVGAWEATVRWVPELRDPVMRRMMSEHVSNMHSWLCGQLQWRFETKRNDDSTFRVVEGAAVRE